MFDDTVARTMKPCMECGREVWGDFSMDGTTLFGIPVVVNSVCDICIKAPPVTPIHETDPEVN